MANSKKQPINVHDGDPSSKRGESSQTPVETSSIKDKATKPRHRASVACVTCRDRRIRCVVPPGDKECTPCKRSGVECVIKNDDERRRYAPEKIFRNFTKPTLHRPISRAYVCSLTERVALLEAMLRDRGDEPPPAFHPPKIRDGHQHSIDHSPAGRITVPCDIQRDHSSPSDQASPQDDRPSFGPNKLNKNESVHSDVHNIGSSSILHSPNDNGIVKRLLSTHGHLSFDQLSGRLRYFGPTTNCHVHSESGSPLRSAQQQSQQTRRADEIISSLPSETHEYLMGLFWQFYNSVLHVLHHEAFNEDRDMGRTQFYSGFLHVCVLAMGFRFADKRRPDIQKLALAHWESNLHREAKYMLDDELERPGDVPLIVALLILSDLETGVGRDTLGWLYGGMAIRLAFDIGYAQIGPSCDDDG
jgi:hypothetical protein